MLVIHGASGRTGQNHPHQSWHKPDFEGKPPVDANGSIPACLQRVWYMLTRFKMHMHREIVIYHFSGWREAMGSFQFSRSEMGKERCQ